MMSDNTANLHTCPDCGVLIDGRYAHACPGTPWKSVTLSPFILPSPEIVDYLRRIAEVLEKIYLVIPREKMGYHDVEEFYKDDPNET